ncbi:MAG TPA: xanthine dehydrogenase family protein molybdopterin-binding subunit [Rhodocyclaceae bacterium]|nr:xanthine dehydrogenase family protein molybdopterin-binding subunit [Rhodocyclaceae bacterium]
MSDVAQNESVSRVNVDGINSEKVVGLPLDRVDGRLKVCGMARYAAEWMPPRMAYAYMVLSTIPSGRIARVDMQAAERTPGVIGVMTHLNAPKLPQGGRAAVNPPAGRVLSLLQDDQIHYNQQPVGIVIADTLEHARDGARALKIEYEKFAAILDFDAAKRNAYSPRKIQENNADSQRGDVKAGIGDATYRISATYITPLEHHNPMEPHATVAVWEGDMLTVYDSTQYVSGVKRTVSKTLGIPTEKVRTICPYVGGGFGCKGSSWSHVVLAAMAARHVGRPVKLVLDRPQMFGPVGGRPNTEQHFEMGAAADGKLTAMTHDVISYTSFIEDWTEPSAMATRMLYACDNQTTSHRLAKLNLGTPTFQRAPGESTGTYALEAAIDEMAYASGMDPLAFRLRNYAEQDPDKNKPFSSKSLRECYRAASERFGWSRRTMQPRSMKDGRWLVGWGMATATYPTRRSPAKAKVRLLPDGTAVVQSGSQDLGTGTYTVMTQVAAENLGYPVRMVRFELGDTALPEAPVSGGSQSVASVSPAVRAAALAARAKLIDLALSESNSPWQGASLDDLTVENGWLQSRSDRSRREPVAVVLARNDGPTIEADGEAAQGEEKNQYSMHSFGAVFTEVRIDRDLGIIRVPRIVAAYGVGNLLNEKTGHSQLMGGIVWGISMALFEKSELDMRYGRIVNNNLAEYHVPVNADIYDVDVIVVPERDPHVNPLGAKGIGEIGITGVAGSIANAVYHATGKRIRDLPIRLDEFI